MTATAGRKPVRPGDQQPPTPNGHPAIQQQVIDDLARHGQASTRSRAHLVDGVITDLEERLRIGVERYGTPLQPFNGRDCLRDAYDEVLDLLCYLKQASIEGHGVAMLYTSARSIALHLREQIDGRVVS